MAETRVSPEEVLQAVEEHARKTMRAEHERLLAPMLAEIEALRTHAGSLAQELEQLRRDRENGDDLPARMVN